MASFDDEDLVPSSKSTLAQNAVSNAPVADSIDDLNVDFGDADLANTSDGLDAIKPAKDTREFVRLALLTHLTPLKAAWMHFVTVNGKKVVIRCLSVRDKKNQIVTEGLCCKKLNHDDDQKAQMNFMALALKYTNAPKVDGKYVKIPTSKDGSTPPAFPAIEWEIGFVKLSRAGYKAIGLLIQEEEEEAADPSKPPVKETVDMFDIVISNKANNIGFDYGRVSKVPRYRLNKDLEAEVIEAASRFLDGKLLAKRLGKVITELDLRALLAGAAAAQGNASKAVDDPSHL